MVCLTSRNCHQHQATKFILDASAPNGTEMDILCNIVYSNTGVVFNQIMSKRSGASSKQKAQKCVRLLWRAFLGGRFRHHSPMHLCLLCRILSCSWDNPGTASNGVFPLNCLYPWHTKKNLPVSRLVPLQKTSCNKRIRDSSQQLKVPQQNSHRTVYLAPSSCHSRSPELNKKQNWKWRRSSGVKVMSCSFI